jgi:hypothetical protein
MVGKFLLVKKKIIPKFFEKNQLFSKSLLRGGRWRNFSLIFSESTKNLVVIIHRSYLRTIWSQLQHRLSDQWPMSTWKVPYKTFYFSFKQGFQIGFFRFGQKLSNLTLYSCTWKNCYFEHFLGQQWLADL